MPADLSATKPLALVTGSIAGGIPGSYNAIYNASKAFVDSFSFALREEVKGGTFTGLLIDHIGTCIGMGLAIGIVIDAVLPRR